MATSGARRPAWRARRASLALALTGLLVVVASGLVARDGTVSAAERSVFRAINDQPEWLYRPMWVFQQFGNVVVAFVIVLVVAVVIRKRWLAIAALGAVVGKLLLERLVKEIVQRERPGTTVEDAILRGDVSPSGLSFVSGHATITFAMTVVLTAALPRRWRWLPWIIAALNGVARVYVGAHNPLDVVGGAGLGLLIGSSVVAVLAPHGPGASDAEVGGGVTAPTDGHHPMGAGTEAAPRRMSP